MRGGLSFVLCIKYERFGQKKTVDELTYSIDNCFDIVTLGKNDKGGIFMCPVYIDLLTKIQMFSFKFIQYFYIK